MHVPAAAQACALRTHGEEKVIESSRLPGGMCLRGGMHLFSHTSFFQRLGRWSPDTRALLYCTHARMSSTIPYV